MTSTSISSAHVWVWLPGATNPIAAGVIQKRQDYYRFAYGNHYLTRPDAVSLYGPELPLRSGWIEPNGALNIASVLRDGGPDAWGQRIILAKLNGATGRDADPGDLDQLAYFLESGSDRIGALDFQHSAHTYIPRGAHAPLTDLLDAADRLQSGLSLPASLNAALLHGTSVGGAQPKAVFSEGQRNLLAKFTTQADVYPTVKAEAMGQEFAKRVGISVSGSELIRVMGREVLIAERFDRTATGGRRMMVSGLTMLGLAEHEARYATYPDLLDRLVAGGTDSEVGRSLFERIVLNVAIGNNDDHARNHAAFWDGENLELTPAYDLTPQIRSGEISAQALAIDRNGARESSFRVCLDAAGVYGLTSTEASEIVSRQIDVIETGWDEVSDLARMSEAERGMVRRSVLNPFVKYGMPNSIAPGGSLPSKRVESVEPGRVWVEPHTRNGKSVGGYFRGRPQM